MPLSDYLVISDIDGTLLKAGQPVPGRNVRAINDFIARGGRFTVCTGRGSWSARAFTSLIDLREPAIICNGTCIFDYSRMETLYAHPLPSDAARVVKEVLKAFPGVCAEIVREPQVFLVNPTETGRRHVEHRDLPYNVAEAEELGSGWNKAVFLCDPDSIAPLHGFLSGLMEGNEEMDHLWVNVHIAELVPKGFSKANGVAKLCELTGTDPGKVIALGDYYNDLELFRAAAFSIAVGDAPEEVRNAADMVTGKCLDGGVADVLEDFERIIEERITGEAAT